MSAEPEGWVVPAAGGATLRVHVRPGSGRPGLAGFHGTALCVRVRARPVEGQANRELVVLLSGILGVAPSVLEILRGQSRRDKLVMVPGVTADAVRARVLAGLPVDTGPVRP